MAVGLVSTVTVTPDTVGSIVVESHAANTVAEQRTRARCRREKWRDMLVAAAVDGSFLY
ncbi:MAG: hypothetical protein Rubg2KO_20380 [Rubricoccaceae bacterium]